MVSDTTLAVRVGGEQLGQHVNSEVILLGQIKKVSSSGKGVELLTTDKVSVNVTLPEALNGISEGYIEVRGTAVSKSTISCKHYVLFEPEMCNDFESDNYNAFLSTLHVIGDKKWKITSDEQPY